MTTKIKKIKTETQHEIVYLRGEGFAEEEGHQLFKERLNK